MKKKWLNYLYVFIVLLILLNVLAVILDTVEEVRAQWSGFLYGFEVFSIIVFTVEYFIRFWFATWQPKYKHPVFGRIRYLFSFYALVDLFAILPFYLPFLIPFDLRFLRMIRLARLFRVFKLGKYSDTFDVMSRVFRNKRQELLLVLYLVLIVLTTCSCLLYLAENPAQPTAFPNIPETMRWCLMTLATVGGGSTAPVTFWGKLLATIMSLAGVGLFAIPAGIMAAGFMEAVQEKKGLKRCPHCKKILREKY